MSRIFIDTLFVVALINRRDQYHAKANELAARYAQAQFLITDAVLMEIGNGLARHFRRQAVDVIEQLRDSADVEIVETSFDRFEQGLALYKQHADKQWGFIDCLSFVAMRNVGVTDALTFDEHFVQAGLGVMQEEATLEVEPACGWAVVYEEPVDPLSDHHQWLEQRKQIRPGE